MTDEASGSLIQQHGDQPADNHRIDSEQMDASSMITTQMAEISLDPSCAFSLMHLLEPSLEATLKQLTEEMCQDEKIEDKNHAEEEEEGILKEDKLVDEDIYFAFGPGGDPGPEKPLTEEQMEQQDEEDKHWKGCDEDYDSFDSYFEEDFDFEGDW